MSGGPRRASALVGYLLVAAAATSWGAQSVVAKLLLVGGLAPSALVSTRTALACLILASALAAVKPALLRVGARDLGRLAVLGVAGMALSNYTYYFALTRIPVATAALLVYTSPIIVLAASVGLQGEPLRRRDVLAAAVTLLGAALVVRAYEPAALRVNLVGIAAGVVNAFAFAFYNLWARTLAPRLSPWTMLAYSLAAAALVWLPLAPPWALVLVSHPPMVWLGLGVVVVFGTLVPFALYLSGLARISAAHASLTSTIEPVVAAGMALAVLGEALGPLQVVGGALVIAGVATLRARA